MALDDITSTTTSLGCLRPSTLHFLGLTLNPRKILLTEDKLLRDWRGLAELSGFSALDMGRMEQTNNPVAEVLRKLSGGQTTIGQFLAMLERMDRYDVIDDSRIPITDDIAFYKQRLSKGLGQPLQVRSQSFSLLESDIAAVNSIPTYDAFVAYAEEDRDFVDELIGKLEGEYGLKLCVKDRDLLAGLAFEHQEVAEIVSSKCRYLLPILSPSFLQSEANKFVIAFAEALGIEKGCRKIVPCVYKTCPLPKSLSYYSRLDFTKANHHWDFWEKMRRSLMSSPSAKLDLPYPDVGDYPNPIAYRQPEAVVVSSFDTTSFARDEASRGLSTDDSMASVITDSAIKEKAAPNSTTRWLRKLVSKSEKNKTRKKEGKAVAL